jgi:hypothetical protein
MGKGDPKGGRPRIEVDWKVIDGLLKIQCTGEEIASFIDVDYDTINRRCKEAKKMGFADYSKQKRFGGKPSLRRAQWKLAIEGNNPTMLIWLGKQMLDQRDKADVDNTSSDGSMSPTIIELIGVPVPDDNSTD